MDVHNVELLQLPIRKQRHCTKCSGNQDVANDDFSGQHVTNQDVAMRTSAIRTSVIRTLVMVVGDEVTSNEW